MGELILRGRHIGKIPPKNGKKKRRKKALTTKKMSHRVQTKKKNS